MYYCQPCEFEIIRYEPPLPREQLIEICPEFIIEMVCASFNKNIYELKTVSQAREFTIPRFVAMQLITEFTNTRIVDIGTIFNRHHTTVVNAKKELPSILKFYSEVKKKYDLIHRELCRIRNQKV